MKNHHEKIKCQIPSFFMLLLVMAPALLLFHFQHVPLYAASISGESNTFLRMGKTADDSNIYPLYEYLNLGITKETGGGSLSGNLGGWGRVDLGNRSTDRYSNADLQYGYISYQGNNNNLLLNAGRQFVAEGVATERVDGVHLRGDLAAGFGIAAFVGSPAVIETDFKGGDVIYGGRVTHNTKYYTVGLSALRTDYEGSRIREESGIDLWFYPIKQVDIVGRSTYNSITSGWMEHAYTVTFSPLQNLRFTADLSGIRYKDFFYQTTTKAFSFKTGLLDPNEKVFALGGGVDYTPVENVSLSVDYKNYAYDIAGAANYYGGKATFTLPESFMAGLAIHRMEGESAKLQYMEYRIFATKKLGNVDLTADLFDVEYRSPINGVKQTYSAAVAAAYAITDRIKIAADVDYSKNPDFDGVLSGMLRFTYAFDKEFGTEGRAESEKE